MGSLAATRYVTKVVTSSAILLATVLCFAVSSQAAKNVATPISAGPPGLVFNLEGHTGVSQFVAFLPDGQRLVSSARDGTPVLGCGLWDDEVALEAQRDRGRSRGRVRDCDCVGRKSVFD